MTVNQAEKRKADARDQTDKENQEFQTFKEQNKEDGKIIRKINQMISGWVSKYKFHTKSLASEEQDKHKHFMTEFSAPSSQKPIPEATAIVGLRSPRLPGQAID